MPQMLSDTTTTTSSHFQKAGRYGVVDIAKQLNNWRDLVVLSQSDKTIRNILSEPNAENAIWHFHYNHRFPELPFPDGLSQPTYKQAFIARHTLYKNATTHEKRLNNDTPEPLRGDRELVMTAVTQDGWALEYASDALQADREVFLAAVTQNGDALRFASDALQADREVVLAAVTRNGYALQYASDALQADREVVMTAVTQDGEALRFASDALQADREVVLAAVTQYGEALRVASAALRADREVVMAAVTQNGYALQYASDALRADREVVLAAVTQNGDALRFASPALQADRDIVLAAATQNGYALQYASRAFWADWSLRAVSAIPGAALAVQHPSTALSLGVSVVSTLALMVAYECSALPAATAGAATGLAAGYGLFALQSSPSHASDNAATPALMN